METDLQLTTEIVDYGEHKLTVNRISWEAAYKEDIFKILREVSVFKESRAKKTLQIKSPSDIDFGMPMEEVILYSFLDTFNEMENGHSDMTALKEQGVS